jgi:uncharacterized membrane protein (UPF0182 family)
MNTRRWLMLALGVAAVLLILGRALAGVYSDYLWYDALGAGALWRLRMSAVLTLRAGSAIAAALFAFCNLYAVRQSVVQLVFPRRVGNLEISEEVSGRYLMGAAIVLSAVLGVLLAIPHGDWMALVLARTGRLFGTLDPYIGADLGFFVYWLPLENTLWTWAVLCVIVISLAVILLYALTPSLKWQRGSIYASMYVRRHFTILSGVMLLMLAWSFRLDMYALLTQGSGADGTFSWVDHQYGITGNLLLSILTLGAGLIVMWAGSVGQFRLAAISVLSVVVMSLVAREVVPAVAQRLGTDAERTARERPYIAARVSYTRRAFGVDLIGRADSTIGFPSIAAALPWVSAWDIPALARAIDAARAAGDRNVRTEWRVSRDGLLADVLAPPPSGATQRAPWTVAHIVASGADERGGPLHAGAQGGASVDDTPVETPLVYPGAPPFAVVADSPDSLNHTVGTPLESVWSRLASAWSLQNIAILTRPLPQPRPTLISRRDVRDRVSTLMPFFTQGRSVEPLLVSDSLYWGIDLYSTSDMYPLSRRAMLAGEERTYFRHAAVAIVQASTGDISVVPDSSLDPIAATWVHRLPSIFGTWNALPHGIRGLLPPAIDGVYAQANAFGRYGSQTESFPPRQIPALDGSDTSLVGDDLPIVLPGAQATAITLPLVDDTGRLRGLLIGAGGLSRATTWYGTTAPGPRWSVVLDRLRSLDSAGAGGIARDGPLSHGRVRLIPLRSGIGFLQPTYRWRPQSGPALNRLAIFVGDTARALLPGGTSPPASASVATPSTGANASTRALYNAMRDALRRGDWAAFGRAFDALGRALEEKKTP